MPPTPTPPIPAALAGPSTTRIDYVGRAGLLDDLEKLWRRAEAGRSATALLAGEPGVGKTRTAAELARVVHADGGRVIYGGCEEFLGLPYHPFAEALRGYISEAGAPLGRLPGELVRLLPNLATFVNGLPAPVAAEPGAEEHRLFDAVSSWLRDAASPAGLLLVLDDLQWATKPTTALILHIVRAAAAADAPLLTLLTYRDTDVDPTHPLSKMRVEMQSVAGFQQATVDNLTEPEVAAFIEATAGHPLDDSGRALSAAVHTETEGNPFFVSEVLRHLVENGELERGDDERWLIAGDVAAITIPESVRDVVGRRLSRLSDSANEVLAVAAVCGRTVDVDVLVAAAHTDEATVADALDEAMAARLIEDLAVGRFRFTHALVPTALSDGLTNVRRSRLHRRVVEALEDVRPTDVVGLAHHSIEAGASGDMFERAVRYGLAAAEQSLAARAFADAQEGFERVLAMLDATNAGESADRVAALCGAGEAQRDQGNPAFRVTLLEASGMAQRLGDAGTALLVRAVLANSRGMVSVVGELDAERVAFIEAALAAISPEPSADRARLLAQYACEVMYGTDHVRRVSLSDDAEAMARQVGDDAVLAWVLARTGYPAVLPSRFEQNLARSEEGVRLADASGDPSLRVFARAHFSAALMSMGRMQDAFRVSDDMVTIADDDCGPGERWFAHLVGLPATYARDGVMAGMRRNDEALAMGQAAGEPDALLWWSAAASGPFWLTGNGGDMADVTGMLAAQTGVKMWHAGHAVMLCEGGRHDEARAVIERAELRNDPLEDEVMPLMAPQQLAFLAWSVDDAVLARLVVPVLERYADRWTHYFLFPLSPAKWGLGAALTVLGDYERAVTCFEETLVVLEADGFADHAMHCRIGLATALLRRGGDGDGARATDVLTTARAHAETIPAPKVIERIDALLASPLP